MTLARLASGIPLAAVMVMVLMGTVAQAGCTYGCDAYLSPSFRIEVFDARTRQAAAAGATISVVGRDFADSVTYGPAPSENSKRYLIWENDAEAGLYIITVQKSGYETWTRLVQLKGDKCHVSPIALDVELRPL
jgi:hypothetical protein